MQRITVSLRKQYDCSYIRVDGMKAFSKYITEVCKMVENSQQCCIITYADLEFVPQMMRWCPGWKHHLCHRLELPLER